MSTFSGIFATETGQRFLLILERLANRGFEGLYTKCNGNTRSSYYQEGLSRVPMWTDDILRDDVHAVRRECPDLDDTYRACFVQYVDERYTVEGKKRSVRTPTIEEFTRRFFTAVGRHVSMKSGDFFASRDPMHARVTCMDAAREAMYDSANADTVRVELASQISAARPDEDDVMPSDSISQVNTYPPAPPRRLVETPIEEDAPYDEQRSTVSRAEGSEYRQSKYEKPDDERSRVSEYKAPKDYDERSRVSEYKEDARSRVSEYKEDARSRQYKDTERSDPPRRLPEERSQVDYTPREERSDPPRRLPEERSQVDYTPREERSEPPRRPRDEYVRHRQVDERPRDYKRSDGGRRETFEDKRSEDYKTEEPKYREEESFRSPALSRAESRTERPVQGSETGSNVYTRHDFQVKDRDGFVKESRASSRDSHVSIGMKKMKSPKM